MLKISFDKIPKSSGLFRDYLYNFDKVRDFYSLAPYDEASYNSLFEKLENREYGRDLLAEILKEQNRVFGNTDATISSIDRIRHGKTFVVFTGQQAGLFGGPLYTLYKAMTAINLARYLTMTTSYKFLPLFWIEGEDHDFEEIRNAYVVDKNNKILRLKYQPEIPFDGRPAGKVILDGTISELISQCSEAFHDNEFRIELLDALRECYSPGKTLSDAFACWMTYLLGKYGLILVDPSDVRFKKIALPVFHKSLLKHRSDVNPALQKANKRLEERGYHNQVIHRMDTLDFFYHEPRRLPFIRQDGAYALKDSDMVFTTETLLEFIDKNISDISPNVILRPQVQDFLFPTAAYVAGPSEVAYFAQFKKVYESFGTPMPIIYPRKSITIIEKHINAILKKFNIEIGEIFGDRNEVEKKILSQNMPDSLRRAVNEARGNIFKTLGRLEKEASFYDPNLKPAIKKLKGRFDGEFSHTERKIAAAVEKKDHIIRDQIDKLFVNLYPDNYLQERRLNAISFIYRYSHRLIYVLMELTCCRHENSHIAWEVDL